MLILLHARYVLHERDLGHVVQMEDRTLVLSPEPALSPVLLELRLEVESPREGANFLGDRSITHDHAL
jgi:hypothetical protein